MSFDSHNLERLRELGRQLPKKLPLPNEASSESHPKTRLHPLETENDPQALFHELMKASPDGTVPSHLITRLKKAEFQLSQPNKKGSNEPSDASKHTSYPLKKNKEIITSSQQASLKKLDKEKLLYTDFEKLLLEDEDEI